MKVAVSSQGQSLEDKMDPRFGRTKHFLIVDTDTMEYRAVDNKQNLQLAQGAGAAIQVVAHRHRAGAPGLP